MGARWTETEDATVRTHYPNLNILVSRLKRNARSATAIYSRAQKLGLVGSKIVSVPPRYAVQPRHKFAENRALLCKAFKLVRNDPAKKEVSDSLLEAIKGPAASVSDEILRTATLVAEEKSSASGQSTCKED